MIEYSYHRTLSGYKARPDIRGDIEKNREDRFRGMENLRNDERFKERMRVNANHTGGKFFNRGSRNLSEPDN